MKNPRVIAGAAVLVLILVVAAAMFVDRAPAQAEDEQAPAPVRPAATAPVTSPTNDPVGVGTEPAPTSEPAAPTEGPAPQEGEDQDHEEITGLDATLTPDERTVAYEVAASIAAAVTAQDPAEQDRAARLAPLFVPGAEAVGDEGPAPHGSVVVPATLNWVKPFQVEDDRSLGLLVSVQYDILRPVADDESEFGQGNAEWLVRLVRDGAGGWLAADVELSTSSDA